MIPTIRKRVDALLFIGLLLAGLMCVVAFLQADSYRKQIYDVLEETYEVQWRTTQIRERLTNVIAELRVGLADGEEPARLDRDARHLATNITATLELPYIGRYLDSDETDRLEGARNVIEYEVVPNLDDQSGREVALDHVVSLRDDLFRVSAAAVANMETLSKTTRKEELFQRFTFFSALSLSVILVIAAVLAWRSNFAHWKDRQLRSFASLFAHMTRTRVAALRLFLERLRDQAMGPPEKIDQARRTVNELISINNGLVSIAYSRNDSGEKRETTRKALGRLLDAIADEHRPFVRLDLDGQGSDSMVPAWEFYVIVDELVGNAKKAVFGTNDPLIKIRARVTRGLFRNRLRLEIEDNGSGMTPDVLARATQLFFSTKVGTHVGLGLSSCAAIVETIGGRLSIDSAPGVGTVVKIAYPLH